MTSVDGERGRVIVMWAAVAARALRQLIGPQP
jgi:hypothetical protein